jgi:hypothetical protein
VPQTILTVVAEVQPASAGFVRQRLLDLTAWHETIRNTGDQPYDAIRAAIPVLHFMSMTVAEDDQYDPIFVLEANFDGAPGPFWAQLEAGMGPELREIFSRCKSPRDSRAELFDSVTAPGASAPIAPLLEALTVFPSTQHQGNRGLSRPRIIAEGKLFLALRSAVDANPALQTVAESQIHRQLRAMLIPVFPWLGETQTPRIPIGEGLADLARAVGLLVLVVALLVGLGRLLFLVGCQLWPGIGFLVAGGLLRLVECFLLGAAVVVPLALLRLRWLERRDASNDAPRLDPVALREMARGEDYIAQNHMISIVHIKPGVLRTVLARLVHRALGLWLRVTAHDGYLGTMRTIHFAHWAFLDNGGCLMFNSNFDGSWESYLDDFIEKSHVGLTLAWTHGVGFPMTRWLYQDGATQGRKFKAWARHSMTPRQFWFSAYKQYSVNQIERHARLANGLRKPELTDQEALAWVIDL